MSEGNNANTESQFGKTHENGRNCQLADAPAIGQWGWLDIVGGQRHAKEVAHHHHDELRAPVWLAKRIAIR
jgi:hypothetical protein